MGLIDLVYNAGVRAMAVVDFNAAGEAAMNVTIGGVVYLEADAADAPAGVWTNGATAANSATSLAAAINGDTRSNKPPVSAFVSDVGDSVIVVADEPGSAGELAITTDSAANATVENMHGSEDNARFEMAMTQYVVTDQDVLADEINLPLSFTPTGFIVDLLTTAGVTDPATFAATIEASPDRLRLNFAGATDPVAGDIVCAIVWRRAT